MSYTSASIRTHNLRLCVHSHDTARRLLTTLRILRKHHGCELPIEIWGFPDELAGLGDVRRDIDALGGHVSWRTVEVEKRGGKWKQFHIVRPCSRGLWQSSS